MCEERVQENTGTHSSEMQARLSVYREVRGEGSTSSWVARVQEAKVAAITACLTSDFPPPTTEQFSHLAENIT